MLKEGGSSFESRLGFAWNLALGRPPSEYELALMNEILSSNRETYKQDPAAAEKLLETGMAPVINGLDKTELASWTAVTRTLLNLHEAITRY